LFLHPKKRSKAPNASFLSNPPIERALNIIKISQIRCNGMTSKTFGTHLFNENFEILNRVLTKVQLDEMLENFLSLSPKKVKGCCFQSVQDASEVSRQSNVLG
jgi:hypothetical protein